MSLSLETWIHCPRSVQPKVQECDSIFKRTFIPVYKEAMGIQSKEKERITVHKTYLQPLKVSVAFTNSKCGAARGLWLNMHIQVDGKSGDE